MNKNKKRRIKKQYLKDLKKVWRKIHSLCSNVNLIFDIPNDGTWWIYTVSKKVQLKGADAFLFNEILKSNDPDNVVLGLTSEIKELREIAELRKKQIDIQAKIRELNG